MLPTSGTREGLFFLTMAAVTAKRHKLGGDQPLVLLPDPGYHVYAGATLAADAEPHYVTVDAAGDHLPDFTALPSDVLGAVRRRLPLLAFQSARHGGGEAKAPRGALAGAALRLSPGVRRVLRRPLRRCGGR